MFIPESGDGLFGDGDIGFVVFGFVVKEPGRQAVFVESGETVEAVVDEFGSGRLAIDQSDGQSDCFGGEKAFLCADQYNCL